MSRFSRSRTLPLRGYLEVHPALIACSTVIHNIAFLTEPAPTSMSSSRRALLHFMMRQELAQRESVRHCEASPSAYRLQLSFPVTRRSSPLLSRTPSYQMTSTRSSSATCKRLVRSSCSSWSSPPSFPGINILSPEQLNITELNYFGAFLAEKVVPRTDLLDPSSLRDVSSGYAHLSPLILYCYWRK